MKKIFKQKRFWIILAIVLVVVIVVLISRQPEESEVVTSLAEKGRLVQSVSATGKVESASETNLNFSATGNLAWLYIKAGDKIVIGQLLAQLQSSQASSQVSSARAQVAQAEADLAGLEAGSTAEEIAVSEAKLSQAQADLVFKEEALAHAESERDQNVVSLKEQALDEADEAVFIAKESLEDVADFINDPAYSLVFSNHPFSHNQAKASYSQAVLELTSLEGIVGNYSMNSSVGDLVYLLDQADGVLTKVNLALDDAYFDLLLVIQPGVGLTETVIDAFKTSLSGDKTSLASNISSVQSVKADLQTETLADNNSVESASADVQKARAAVAVAQAELALKKAGPTESNLFLYQAKLSQANANLQKALADLSDYSIKSPLEGIVTKINYEVGEYIASNQPVLTVISESNLEIGVDVPESDIAKVKAGDEAAITLDAFGDERVFSGHITFVDPAETIINDVVYYQVKVTFDQENAEVKSGMTANVSATTAVRQEAVFIPARAVVEAYDRKFVRIRQAGEIKEMDVTTGLRGDNGMIEITSGVSEGDEVVTYIKNGK
ncbi:MAG TPA: efflux RND transporter periplasmic adaptor subunit [Patescibacteria group bacterium]|nr:efflux RND transporter periplasmic adaptor subunit [Patescibacteria group bacterium]